MKSKTRVMRARRQRCAVAAPCCLILALWAAPTAAQAPAPRTVEMDEAVRLALLNNPAMIEADGAVADAGATMLEARGAFLPSLFVNSGYTNSSNQRFDQATGRLVSESFTARTQLNYDVFSGGRRIAEYKSAGARIRSADAALRAQRFQTILDTRAAYYAAAAADELVGVARQRLERAKQQREFAGTRLDVGTATRSDVLRAELEEGNAEIDVVDAEAALRTARLTLGRQIGIEGEVQPGEAALPSAAPLLPPLDSLVAMAVAASPAAVSARADASESRANRFVAVTSYIPTITASAGYDWFAFDFPPTNRSWSLRVTASLPVFNGLQREATLSRAGTELRIAEARARDAEIGARLAAIDAATRIESAQRRVAIAARAVDLAREDLRVQEERYQIGVATILELLTSQVALSDAEVAHVRSRQQLGVTLAELEAVLGKEIPAG